MLSRSSKVPGVEVIGLPWLIYNNLCRLPILDALCVHGGGMC